MDQKNTKILVTFIASWFIQAATPILENSELCKKISQKHGSWYLKLQTHLVNPVRKETYLQGNPLLNTDMETKCQGDQGKSTLKSAISALNTKKNIIGVILPLSGPYQEISNEILAGIKAANQDHYQVIAKDSASDPQIALRGLAELVINLQATYIITGLDSKVASALQPWADRLAIPMIQVSGRTQITKGSKYATRVFPEQGSLAHALAKTCQIRAYKKVAFLIPENRGVDILAEQLKHALHKNGIETTHEATYSPGDYDSMEQAVKTIFQQHPTGRESEYRNLVWEARRKARASHTTFKARMLVLPPIKSFDAVFIGDHFKNARHLIKIFKYLGVNQMPVFGSHEWRSPGLIAPYDDFLEGAFFADFIGSYKRIPKPLQLKSISDEYFINGQQAQKLDFQIIGYRALDVIQKIDQNKKGRLHWPKVSLATQDTTSPYFKHGPIFDKHRHSNWPAFVFSVQSKSIQKIGEYR